MDANLLPGKGGAMAVDEGRVFKRSGTDNWWVAYYVAGVEYRESSGSPRREEAEALLKRRIDEKGAYRIGLLQFPEVSKLTVADLIEGLLADYRIRGRKSLRTTRVHSGAILRYFGEERASGVSMARLRDYVSRRLDEGAANATVNRELAALRRAFNLAFREGRVTKVPPFPMLAESNVRRGFLEVYDVDLVVRALPDYLQGMVRFAYLTGWRLSEITGLRWEDVDLYNDAIVLPTSKNSRGRVLSLTGELREIIHQQAQDASEWVFHREGRPVGDFRKAWRTACRAAGVPGKRFHDFRRSAVRNLVRAGVDT
jgi:integrase